MGLNKKYKRKLQQMTIDELNVKVGSITHRNREMKYIQRMLKERRNKGVYDGRRVR